MSQMASANNGENLDSMGSQAEPSAGGKGQKRAKAAFLKYEELPRSSPLDQYFDLGNNK